VRRLTRRQRISAIVLAAVAVCFVTLDLGGGALRGAHSGVRGTLGALYRGTDAMLGPARRWVEGLPSAGSNQGRIEQLQHENAQLRGRVAALESRSRTATAVRGLREAADGLQRAVVPARVVGYGPGEGFDWTVTIDAGTRDGVRAGQSVTDGAALVGRVLHADANSSAVLLAADPGSGVGARDQRSGEIGMVAGNGSDGFVFTPLRPKADIAVGDQFVTGPSNATSYVPDLEVGTVSSVRTSADGSVTAVISPAASPTTVDVVGVLTGRST
jgi:rod shape-determining protein MreC